MLGLLDIVSSRKSEEWFWHPLDTGIMRIKSSGHMGYPRIPRLFGKITKLGIDTVQFSGCCKRYL